MKNEIFVANMVPRTEKWFLNWTRYMWHAQFQLEIRNNWLKGGTLQYYWSSNYLYGTLFWPQLIISISKWKRGNSWLGNDIAVLYMFQLHELAASIPLTLWKSFFSLLRSNLSFSAICQPTTASNFKWIST